MKKISIKDVVEFTRKSERRKHSFATSLKQGKEKNNPDGGGDYWVSAISSVSNSYKLNIIQPVIDKRYELEEKYEETSHRGTKIMYRRNIDILYGCEEFDLTQWRPLKKMKFMKKYREHSVLSINGLQIQVLPSHVFAFKNGDIEEIGAIWFVAKLDGYKRQELGMFVDILQRYLSRNFSDGYRINPEYCVVVDIVKGSFLNYLQLKNENIPELLDSTIEEIKNLM